jgi:DNA topoisomerase-1
MAGFEIRAPVQDTGLVYYPDSQPGILRRRCGRGFSYLAPDGTRIDRGTERKRLEAMAVPPAYSDVWMSPLENGHLMATGKDARARKQYRYHPDWSAAQSEAKYRGLAEFGAALPRIRRHVQRGLAEPPGSRSFTIMAALHVIDRLAMRVGCARYAAENGSYGALTLRRRHLKRDADGLRLCYVAKGGQKVVKEVPQPRTREVLEALAAGPGLELFLWRDAAGRSHALSARLLNEELAEIAALDGATAKEFRTWHGSLAAFRHCLRHPGAGIGEMAEAAAARLANTPTVARNSYIHPKVIALADDARPRELPKARAGLSRSETALLDLIG